MPNTTNYEFGDVVLVPFPFADIDTTKKRPAVVISTAVYHAEALVISSSAYHANRLELIILVGITGTPAGKEFGTVTIQKWQQAGLSVPSRIKPHISTLTKDRIIRKLGKLETVDKNSVRKMLVQIISLSSQTSSGP